MSGIKLDEGKYAAAIPIKDFNLALKAVAEVGTFGMTKGYSRVNWKQVDNAIERYEDALYRHAFNPDEYDDESGCLHLAHQAWNTLVILQLKLEKEYYIERPTATIKDQPELDF